MTGRERVTATLSGRTPDCVPFSPNIGQWFDYHRTRGTLPELLRDCPTELDAMKRLDCDIFSRRLCAPVKATRDGYDVRVDSAPDGSVRHVTTTPVGILTSRSTPAPESHTTYTSEYAVKSVDDVRALVYIVEHTHYRFDADAYKRADAALGDAGVLLVPFFQSPIKYLHTWAGQETATYLLLDEPDVCDALFEVYSEKVFAVAREAAESPALAFCAMDNLDTWFHTPALVRRFAFGFYRTLADTFHARGKLLFSHACGHVLGLRELVDETGLDGFEGVPHPPLGDATVRETRDFRPNFIVVAGITAHESEMAGPDARERLFAYVRDLFESLSSPERFVFSSACNTSIRTPFENLLALRDACREYGVAS
jgi:uroporphyrinogen-III decarboxylase